MFRAPLGAAQSSRGQLLLSSSSGGTCPAPLISRDNQPPCLCRAHIAVEDISSCVMSREQFSNLSVGISCRFGLLRACRRSARAGGYDPSPWETCACWRSVQRWARCPRAPKISIYPPVFKHGSGPDVTCCRDVMGSHQGSRKRKALASGGSLLSFLEVSVGRN